ncbi:MULTISPECIES: glutathione peroxidase [Pseudomonadati]|uniref:Glutathione peroxidase n=1 Tax=Shewanella aestuarii TaxID=1028752 RepID=A0ABT0L059_9GAMM|nr:glutathione peroxidase [Shewanella aestuarii]MCL1117098.1 glutathione peroxidase [Shewanella aestuarii]GGN76179.1 glutathione peroxidase [Shewanella aestuarii]
MSVTAKSINDSVVVPFIKGAAVISTLFVGATLFSATAFAASCPDYLNVEARKLHSQENVNLCELTQGKSVLIVNTASNCGFTPQFKALEALHQNYKDKGLVVIGFPSDDFFQEEKDEAKTADVCFLNYGVTFTMVATSPVRGSDANSVFEHLNAKTSAPKWNFYKYLVSSDGETVTQFNSRVKPDSEELKKAIEKQLSL